MSPRAPTVDLQLPLVLEPVLGRDRLRVRGHDIAEVLEAAFAQAPVLRHHLTVESGELRPHILCLLNGVNVSRDQIHNTTLSEGDEILIHQAISGG